MRNPISNNGSVEDIRGSLRHMNPTTKTGINEYLDYLNFSFIYEITNKNRNAVRAMLEAKINKLKKMSERFLNG
jgi:hypothetical protein